MHSSRSPPLDARLPWMLQSRWTRRVHETGPRRQGHGPLLNAPEQEELPPEVIQNAPPLAAYSADHCGLDILVTEYTRACQMLAFSGRRDVALLPPQILRRRNRLEKIRATGYTLLAPIGINKTMDQIDEEARYDDADPTVYQAENLTLPQEQLSRTVTASSPSAPQTSAFFPELEHDLDALVVDADLSDLEEHNAAFYSDSPDEFMAEEVEYQRDHSLDLRHAMATLLHADAATVSSRVSLLNSATILPTSTIATATTAASTRYRACDDSDADMTLDD